MSAERPRQNECPADVLGWIPWYPEGLDDAKRGVVEAHAAGCNNCRDEIAALQGLATGPEAPDPERVYAQVLARMESTRSEADDPQPAAVASVSHLPAPGIDEAEEDGPEAPVRIGWRRIAAQPSIRRLALAAGLLMALAVGAVVGPPQGLPGSAPEPVYETASDSAATASPSADRVALDVVFRDDATASQINQALRVLGARITGGPSQLGVYRVELHADSDLTAAKKLLTEDRGVASFAEKPLHP